ncbi:MULTISPECIES: glutathione S-transferase [Aliivibrio]|uniref:Glutathione S-transferase n=1 Tax=Aliivibrio finisterrensis TaxID=511998 RepID=A0A4Q5KUB7_9GAMM|nr:MULTISPECIES: glutathione S-transferase [Aliivibrio]MDD9179112.1 glutathione S-transferase [Aliivibrio sp. A6]RYU51575.1 glutathione S-transferase [Aliivibrio finisterrensis]RYU52800.1 glutathione S-transferase [Aliivibrio finisterrensis]RYU58298.1 glutathione S-transferase [Aliivibrio finisterrensis]RYU64115.1 glutathione S-transferase [Aliivibrio finisterrensis]
MTILYSFRRCPYAMRARLSIALSNKSVHLREIILKHKPEAMIQVSPKGTVPVLIEKDGHVIDESLDVMKWALEDSELLLSTTASMYLLIEENDHVFKGWLDKYKYADRYPENTELYYREQGELFLERLEQQLSTSRMLFSDEYSLADLAILPFIRQFAFVNIEWFNQSKYQHVKHWLTTFIDSELFLSIMKKYPTWLDSNQDISFPER